MMKKGCNSNHPKKGASIKVQPIRHTSDIDIIKHYLRNEPRNLCLFTMGINTAYRASELLSVTVGQVAHLKKGDVLEIKQSKNKAYRATVLNGVTVEALQNWLKHHPYRHNPHAPLFMSHHFRHRPLSVPAVNQLVKAWCRNIGLSGNYGSHTLRKTWGYHQRIKNKVSVALLMCAFGHSTEAQTLEYLCILSEEIKRLYLELEL